MTDGLSWKKANQDRKEIGEKLLSVRMQARFTRGGKGGHYELISWLKAKAINILYLDRASGKWQYTKKILTETSWLCLLKITIKKFIFEQGPILLNF
jgi:hypothetical protein